MADQTLIEKIHEAVIATRLEDALYDLKKWLPIFRPDGTNAAKIRDDSCL
jgi:hypothetical protein